MIVEINNIGNMDQTMHRIDMSSKRTNNLKDKLSCAHQTLSAEKEGLPLLSLIECRNRKCLHSAS